jgi:hypothetical protein
MADYLIIGTVFSEYQKIPSTNANPNAIQDGSEITSGVSVDALDVNGASLLSFGPLDCNAKGKFIVRFLNAAPNVSVTLTFSRSITFQTPPPQFSYTFVAKPGKNNIPDGTLVVPY